MTFKACFGTVALAGAAWFSAAPVAQAETLYECALKAREADKILPGTVKVSYNGLLMPSELEMAYPYMRAGSRHISDSTDERGGRITVVWTAENAGRRSGGRQVDVRYRMRFPAGGGEATFFALEDQKHANSPSRRTSGQCRRVAG